VDDRKRTILVVDDEEAIRKFMNIHLTKEGYDVVLSSGGNGVFKALKENSYELVISDIRMPEVDGISVLKHVKESFDTIPVIMLTGLVDITVAVDVMKIGAFDYLIKPIKKENLIRTVHKALSQKDLLEKNKRLEKENLEYQLHLENKVEERTKELTAAYTKLESLNIQFVNALANTIEAKDKLTHGHCSRMMELCKRLGALSDLPKEELDVLLYASTLHDLGKISVKESILNKNGPLTEEERKEMMKHPEIGENILKRISFLEPIAGVVGKHHENFDGSGYPNGLKGEEIPITARIISVADTFDAMNNTRPYRKKLAIDEVLGELKRIAGTQLDPDLVELFINNKLYLPEDGK
jgi:response regulator RpfG family c-di-GMP phosphodiesterase